MPAPDDVHIKIATMLAGTRSLADQIWDEAYAAGAKATREKLFAALADEETRQTGGGQKPEPLHISGRVGVQARTLATVDMREPIKRAPKGSVERVVDTALMNHPAGLSAEAILDYGIHALSAEVAMGSIRNRLRDLERAGAVNREGDIWFFPAARIVFPIPSEEASEDGDDFDFTEGGANG